MTSIFIGGAAEAVSEASLIKDWLTARGVETVTLDSDILGAGGSIDDAVKALSGTDGVILLASPLGRARLSFAPQASAAAFSDIPILLVAWPGVDLRAALPTHVHAAGFLEAPTKEGLSPSAESSLEAFLATVSPPEEAADDDLFSEDDIAELDVDEAGTDGLPQEQDLEPEPEGDFADAEPSDAEISDDEALLESFEEELELEDAVDEPVAPQEPVAAARSSSEAPAEAEDAAFGGPGADTTILPSPSPAAPAGPPPVGAPEAPGEPDAAPAEAPAAAPPSHPAPSPVAAAPAGDMAPPSLDQMTMLARAPGAPLPTGAITRTASQNGPMFDGRRARGPLNAADRTRDELADGAARSAGSGALIATGVVLAAAAAAAYLFGPKIVEWLGLGAAIAVPAGGMGQPVEGDRVEASVFAPPRIARGDVARVQVFLSTREQREEARTIAQEQDSSATRRAGRALSANLKRGAEIEVALVALDQAGREAFDIDAQTETIIWDGEATSVDFFIEAQQTAIQRNHRLAAVLLRDGKPIGELRFVLEAVAEQDTAAAPPLMGPANTASQTYRNIFLSYAREDIDAVRLVARSYRMLEQDFFWDVDDLEPGQSWEQELERRIDSADVFVLFWSEAARESQWVRREVEMALAREAMTGKPRFMPFPIEGPPPAEPWESIAARHIGDPLYFRAVQAARKKFAETQEK